MCSQPDDPSQHDRPSDPIAYLDAGHAPVSLTRHGYAVLTGLPVEPVRTCDATRYGFAPCSVPRLPGSILCAGHTLALAGFGTVRS